MIIIDVRTPEEFAEGHVEDAESFPLQQMVAGEMPLHDVSEEIAIYCRSGVRAKQAVELMKQHGFTNVTEAGGLEDVTSV